MPCPSSKQTLLALRGVSWVCVPGIPGTCCSWTWMWSRGCGAADGGVGSVTMRVQQQPCSGHQRVSRWGRKRGWRCRSEGSRGSPAVSWQGINEPLENYCPAVPGLSSESAKYLLFVWSSCLTRIAVTQVSLLEGGGDRWSPTAGKMPALPGFLLVSLIAWAPLLAHLFWEKLQLSSQIFRLCLPLVGPCFEGIQLVPLVSPGYS